MLIETVYALVTRTLLSWPAWTLGENVCFGRTNVMLAGTVCLCNTNGTNWPAWMLGETMLRACIVQAREPDSWFFLWLQPWKQRNDRFVHDREKRVAFNINNNNNSNNNSSSSSTTTARATFGRPGNTDFIAVVYDIVRNPRH